MNIRTYTLPALLVSALLVSSAQAANTSSNMTVKMTVTGTCTVSSSEELTFPSSTSTVITERTATAKVKVNCSSTIPYTVKLNQGGGSGTVAVRKMSSGVDRVDYVLYTNSSHTTIWGDGTSSTNTVSDVGTSSIKDHTVYGKVPMQTKAPGNYTDTVPVLVEW